MIVIAMYTEPMGSDKSKMRISPLLHNAAESECFIAAYAAEMGEDIAEAEAVNTTQSVAEYRFRSDGYDTYDVTLTFYTFEAETKGTRLVGIFNYLGYTNIDELVIVSDPIDGIDDEKRFLSAYEAAAKAYAKHEGFTLKKLVNADEKLTAEIKLGSCKAEIMEYIYHVPGYYTPEIGIYRFPI